MSQFWLAKSEASVYSIEDLKRDKKTLWEGVRNYQARNFLRDEWKVGDKVLFYHSNSNPTGIAGLATVLRVGIPDPLQFDRRSDYFEPRATKDAPIWFAPEIKFERAFAEILTLDQIKKMPKLKGMQVLKRGNRLSVQPVAPDEFKEILRLV